jgi:hypothetical protein
MPLKLTDINNPVSTNLVNKWADDKEQQLSQHDLQIKTLTATLASLLAKNPTLVKPNGLK